MQADCHLVGFEETNNICVYRNELISELKWVKERPVEGMAYS